MKIQKPTPGRVVLFTDADGDVTPAVVVRVQHGLDVTFEEGEVTLRDFAELKLLDEIKHNAEGKPNTWRFPPFTKDEIEVPE